jgi:hypothetical protein
MDEEQLKYPIGKFHAQKNYSEDHHLLQIRDIRELPFLLGREVRHLSNEQLDTVYRPDGWTIRQVVNHLSDSHMNGLLRFKWALTENEPIIKPYLEEKWAELPDSASFEIEPALQILEGVHQRWVHIMENFSPDDWRRTYIHPEKGGPVSLLESASNYAWHGKHHLAHITVLKHSKGW